MSDRDGLQFGIYVMNADGTAVTGPTTGLTDGWFPDWSPDGTKIAFMTRREGNKEIYTMNPDGTGQTNITNSSAQDSQPSWSPNGTKIAFMRGLDIYTMNADGTTQTALGSGQEPAWSPDGEKIAFFAGDIFTMSADGSERTNITQGWTGASPAWQPIAQSALTGYPRPMGATPLRVSLVQAYLKCTAPNRVHGPSLASPSCSPPAQLSPYATVGTPDANGQPSKSVSSIRMDTILGDPATPADEADVALAASVTDIRSKADLSDYTGELQVTATVRITDRDNGGLSGTDAGTVSDLSFSFTVLCVATPDTTVGSACAASTTADALVPSTIREGKRAIWEFGQVQVTDGGEDGLASTTTDNTLFMKQGIFVP